MKQYFKDCKNDFLLFFENEEIAIYFEMCGVFVEIKNHEKKPLLYLNYESIDAICYNTLGALIDFLEKYNIEITDSFYKKLEEIAEAIEEEYNI